MSENRSASGCPVNSEGLLLHVYGEVSPDIAERIENHIADCGVCRAELASLRQTIETIDRAELASMALELADRDAPGAWDNIAFRLTPGRRTTPYWLQAAAVLLVAGASFLAGVEWMSTGGRATRGFARKVGSKDAAAAAQADGAAQIQVRDPGAGLREFTTQTDGYLNRSRIILLEIANADTGSDSAMLREATRSLLAETRDARRIADQIPDARVDEVLARLETVLIEISGITNWNDAATVQRIRDQVNESGLLEQIEILVPPPTHLAHKRIGR